MGPGGVLLVLSLLLLLEEEDDIIVIRFGRNLGEKEEVVAAADMNCTLVSLQEITLVEEEHSKAIKVTLVAAIATYQINPSCCCGCFFFFFFFHHSRHSCTLQTSSLKLLPDQRVNLLADLCSQSSNSLSLSLSLSLIAPYDLPLEHTDRNSSQMSSDRTKTRRCTVLLITNKTIRDSQKMGLSPVLKPLNPKPYSGLKPFEEN